MRRIVTLPVIIRWIFTFFLWLMFLDSTRMLAIMSFVGMFFMETYWYLWQHHVKEMNQIVEDITKK